MAIYQKINTLFVDRPQEKVAVLLAIARNQQHQEVLQTLLSDDSSFEAYVFQLQLEGKGDVVDLLAAGALARQQDITYKANQDLVVQVLGVSAAQGISSLPVEVQEQLFQGVSKALGAGENAFTVALKPFLGDLAELKSLPKNIGVVLVAAVLTWEAVVNIKKWWQGEISGKRCAKNVMDAIGSVGGGYAGAAAGVYVGFAAGPVGAVLGAVAGGLMGSSALGSLSDWATQSLFDVPKDVAAENAYNYLEVSQTASNDEINKSYKRLCLRYHPDKGGSDEAFHKLQLSLEVVRNHRS